MIDIWKLVKDYKVGDFVQRFIPGQMDLSSFFGRVTAVHPGTGYVDVQWPFGNERHSSDEVVRVNPEFARYLPPSLNFSWYPGFDVTRQASLPGIWRTDALPKSLYIDMARLQHKAANEVTAYDELWHKYGSHVDDEILRGEVSKFYALSRNAGQMLLQKTSAYWVAQGRQYRVTMNELDVKKPACPKCGKAMRRTTYKMDKGAKARLFACPKCLFLIKRESLLGPDGQPVEW
jgi:hypothetical protein